MKVHASGVDVLELSKGDGRREGRVKRRKRLSAYDVSKIVIAKKLRDRTALLAFATKQEDEGKTDLAEFLINRGSKVVNELITNAWEMENAQVAQRRKEKSRMDLLRDACDGQCSSTEEGEWLRCAIKVIVNLFIWRWHSEA